MNKQQLNSAITKVAKSTDKTEQQIMDKLLAKDSWTWFLIKQS
jgi:hypothetical protein